MSFEFKAVRYKTKNSPLEIKTVSLPVKRNAAGDLEVQSDEILVKVKASALNPADLMVKSMAYPAFSFRDRGFGFDFSGDVAAIGVSAAAKTNFRVGDRVCGLKQYGDGGLAEYALVNPFERSGASVRKIPGNLTYEQAAAYPLVFGTAESMFEFCKHKKNGKSTNSFDKVLILAAGTSVGRYAVQLAKQVYGSEHIVVTCSGKTEPIARQYGATEVIDYTAHKNILNPVLESVKATGKFDAILDTCGNNDLFPNIGDIIKSRADSATYVTLVGDAKADYKKGLLASILKNFFAGFRSLRSSLGLLPYYYGYFTLNTSHSWPDHLVEFFEKDDIDVVIDSVYPFQDFQKAVDRLQTNRAVGKVVITI